MSPYPFTLLVLGVALIGAVWLPHLLRKRALGFPVLCVVFGYALYLLPLPLPDADPIRYAEITERLTEFVVLVALTGAGLRIDTPFSWRRWSLTWRLLAVTMPLCIAAAALLGIVGLGLGLASALLLGAVLAPTDPVLASDVQVGPPGGEAEDPVRFALTSEAGLNDGLAFPFSWLAVAAATAGAGSAWLWDWVWLDLLYRSVAGIAIGWSVGLFLMWVIFRFKAETKLAHTNDGMAALAITLTAYGLAELAHGYGFLAVFVAALAVRNYERDHEYHASLTRFAEQIERILMAILLILFGGALAGGVLEGAGWPGFVFALVFVFAVRPLTGMLALTGSPVPWRERLVIAFFGVRGIGSFYYLAFALTEARFDDPSRLWAIVSLVVLLSILLHGLTATPILRSIDDRRDGGH
ncbi:MAG TPA: cation:proton antiporter [Gammaproteobacteria bacterium]|nr:cation:proton antiporter [Gammaproteobacteria bacterium]